MNTKNNASLIAHIARVEGQLAAVRVALAADDCSKAARTLLAASRSLDSVRAACAEGFLTKRIFKNAKIKDPALMRDIQFLIKA